ncbi:MAG: cytochrome c [Candidatus Binatia bacterium]
MSATCGKGHRRSGWWAVPGWLTAVGLCIVVASGVAQAFTQSQADSGEHIFEHQCARCHGPKGEGKDDSYRGLRAPELIGPTALPCKPRAFQKLRTNDFRTLKDVYEFSSTTMPADQPASLSAEEYWNVLAFIRERNGATANNQRLTDTTSRQITLHADCAATAAAHGAQQ